MSKIDFTLTAEYLRQLLDYNPTTGIFTWLRRAEREKKFNTRLAGKQAGCLDAYGYVVLTIDRKQYKAHRLAWMHVYGEWPHLLIDHRNGSRNDNRLWNLRDASPSVNAQNLRKSLQNNRVGFMGVAKRGERTFEARIVVEGTYTYLGVYSTPEEAHESYLIAKRKMHEGCTI